MSDVMVARYLLGALEPLANGMAESMERLRSMAEGPAPPSHDVGANLIAALRAAVVAPEAQALPKPKPAMKAKPKAAKSKAVKAKTNGQTPKPKPNGLGHKRPPPRLFELDGKMRPAKECAQILGIAVQTVFDRANSGRPLDLGNKHRAPREPQPEAPH